MIEVLYCRCVLCKKEGNYQLFLTGLRKNRQLLPRKTATKKILDPENLKPASDLTESV